MSFIKGSDYMKHKYFLISILFVFSLLIHSSKQLSAQINIDTTYTPAQLVQNFLIGQGVIASNVSYTGAPEAIGYFNNGGTTNLGLDSGVVLSSGDVTLIPNNSSNSAGKNLNLSGDSLLQSLIPGFTTNDAVILEFDFIPVSDTIKFRYIFGSDEYPEYVNSSFNDVFGFFITSGLNPNTGNSYNNENIALIPNTNTPVSIDNVNGTVNSQYYVNNNNATGLTVEYDGFTTVLTAWARVIPCTSYHIKIGIADAGDHILDSGVFLDAYSFTSNTISMEKTFSNSRVDSIAIEGCNNTTVTFRLQQTKSTSTTIPLSYGGTAQYGTDYQNLPNSVTIPAGQDSASITIIPIQDSITEPTEVVDIIYPLNCSNDTIHAYIRDNDVMSTTVSSDTTLCSMASATLKAKGQGGISPFQYNWTTGDTTSNTQISPTTTTTYAVSTTDMCNTTIVDSILVKVSNPVIQPSHDSVCTGDTATLAAFTPGAQSYNWSTGASNDSIFVTPNSVTGYQVTVTDSLGCIDEDTVYAYINPKPNILISPDTTICKGGKAFLSASGGQHFQWNNGSSGQNVTVQPLQDKTYSVIVTNQFGCIDSAETDVFINPYPVADITSPKDTVCRGEFVQLTASPADAYKWSTGASTADINVSPAKGTRYTVTVSNIMNGTTCSDTSSKFIEAIRCNTYFIPNTFTPNGDGVNDHFGLTGQFKNVTEFEFWIFDRWGNVVFHTGDYYESWDGTGKNNNLLPNGTYVYKARIKEGNMEPIILQGSVMLLR